VANGRAAVPEPGLMDPDPKSALLLQGWSQAPAAPRRAPRKASGPKTALQKQFSGSGALRAQCELLFWAVFGGARATPGFLGSVELGGVLLAHFCIGHQKKIK
jgi:hypothetical protein